MKNKGFTLVELAIVIVIIGLLVGGVLQGQALIQASKLQRLAADFQSFSAAYNTYQAKYNCLPGDCINASTFFTGASNGNGNKQFGDASTGWGTELNYFWQHLNSAKMLPNQTTKNTTFLAPYIAPSSTLFAASVNPIFFVTTGDYYGITILNGRNLVALAGFTGGSADLGILKPEDIFQVDKKLDDGKPRSGIVTSGDTSTGTCFNATTLEYDLTVAVTSCRVFYEL